MMHRVVLLFALVVCGVSLLASASAADTQGVAEGASAAVEPEVVVTYWLTDSAGYLYRVLVNGTAVNGEALLPGRVQGQDIVGCKNGPDFAWATVERNRYHGAGGTDYHLLSAVILPMPLNHVWTNNIGGGSGVGQLWLTEPGTWLHESFNDYVADGWGGGTGTWTVVPSALPNSRNSVVFETAGNEPPSWQDVYYLERRYSALGYEASFKRGPADDGQGTMALLLHSDGSMQNAMVIGITQADFMASGKAAYIVFKAVGGVQTVIQPWTESPNLITGGDKDGDFVLDSPVWNTIKVVTNGEQYDIYFNHLYETTVFDRELTYGLVGLAAANFDPEDVVQADNVTVDPYAEVIPLAQIVAPAPAAGGGDTTGEK